MIRSVASLRPNARWLERFLASIPDRRPAEVDALAELAELAELLGRKLTAAADAWPEIELDAAALLPYVAERLGPGDVAEALERIHVSDLHLACGCAAGDPRALAAFERALFREVDAAIASLRAPSALVDDIKQWLRRRLFVAEPGARPRIADYAGAGELRTWFRVIAMRAIVSELRKTRREVAASAQILDALAAPAVDSELSLIKRRYQAEFKAAFEEAVASLAPRQRNLLRQQLVDELSVDEIAAIYRAHRVTIARWLAKARKDVWTATRKALAAQLELSPSELEAALREIRSQLDLSLSRVLKTQ
jgi:RNA polymerase sigma-70 factor (ECF subfamily)